MCVHCKYCTCIYLVCSSLRILSGFTDTGLPTHSVSFSHRNILCMATRLFEHGEPLIMYEI